MQTKPPSQDPDAAARRQAIRETWLPRAQNQSAISTRFVVGKSSDPADAEALQEEMQQHPGEFLVLDVDVCLYPTASSCRGNPAILSNSVCSPSGHLSKYFPSVCMVVVVRGTPMRHRAAWLGTSRARLYMALIPTTEIAPFAL